MKRIFRHRPAPATVIATIALLVALGGTSAAAVQTLEPPNSVGTAQVINNSLLSKDFKAGQVPPATNGYAVSVDGPVVLPAASLSVATLKIPKAGSYVMWAKTVVENTSSADEAVACELQNGSSTDTSRAYMPKPAGNDTVSNLLVGTFTGAGNVQLACSSATGHVSARGIELVAVKVATLASS